MADPQTENGYTRIANELFEAILKHPLTQRQQTALFAVVRLTYGYNRKSDRISASRVARASNLARNHAGQALAELAELGLIWRKQIGTQTFEIGIEKDFESWRTVPKSGTVNCPQNRDSKKTSTAPKMGTDCPQNGHGTVPKMGTHKRQKTVSKDKEEIRSDRSVPRTESETGNFLDDLVSEFGQAQVDKAWSRVPAHAIKPLPYLRTILQSERDNRNARTKQPDRETITQRARREAREKLDRLFDPPVGDFQ